MGSKVVDERFKALPKYSELKHFKSGVSAGSKWTGSEYKQMLRTFQGVIAGAVDPRVSCAIGALLDFITYAQYQSHTTESLSRMEQLLKTFHDAKDVFVELGVREDFNIPKLHSLLHYVNAVKRLGSADGFNTEHSERLHIDFAKDAYTSTNGRNYIKQMTLWIQRQEAVVLQSAFLEWFFQHRQSVASLPHFIVSSSKVYTTAKKPPFFLSPHTLAHIYGAPDFLKALEAFLQRNVPNSAPPTIHDRFNCYKVVYIRWSATPYSSEQIYRVYATPGHSNGPHQPPTKPQFDTILFAESERTQTSRGFQGMLITNH
jgi:hypothetical protein